MESTVNPCSYFSHLILLIEILIGLSESIDPISHRKDRSLYMNHSALIWYTEHRLEFLRNRMKELKAKLDIGEISSEDFPYELLLEFMEIKGRIKELENIIEHSKLW